MTKLKSYKYNGHKNYNCWNVSLYIDNEYDIYQKIASLIKRRHLTKDTIATLALSILTNFYGDTTPDGVKFTYSNVREYFRRLDRSEYIADQNYYDDYHNMQN